jgi:phage-related minor tail protein
MASKKILGLTVQIGASTTQLDKALANIRKESKEITDDLRTVNQQLKFDPKNTELQAQRMDLLAKSVQNSEKKADAYKRAQQSVNQALAEGKITTAQAEKALDEFSDEIRKAGNESKRTKAEFNGMGAEIKTTGKEMDTAGKSALTMGKLIKGNLISSAVISGLKTVGNTIKSIGTALWNGAKAAAHWTFKVGKATIESGAAMRETLGTTERVFGDDILQNQLDPWAKTGYKTMGLSRESALDLANKAGNLLVNKGMTEQQAAEIAMQLVQRSADIGANYNMGTDEAMNYFLSMLKGQYNSADSIGIVTNASAINARALENKLQDVDTSQIIGYGAALDEQKKAEEALTKAIDKYGLESEQAEKANSDLTKATDKLSKMTKAYVGEITDADKALAAYQIGLEQTAKAEGTFADEAKGWNGLKKILSAGLSDIQEKLGGALLPAAESMLGTFSAFLEGEKGQKLVSDLANFLEGLSVSAAEWINNGGLDDFSAGVETVIGKIAELFSPENEQKIEAWVSEKLPQAIETAKTALNEFVKFLQEVNGIIDKIKEITAPDREARTAYDQAKAEGKTELEAQAAYDEERAQLLKEKHDKEQAEKQWAATTSGSEWHWDEIAGGFVKGAAVIEDGGNALKKEETKIVKDTNEFGEENSAAMKDSVKKTQASADTAKSISLSAYWGKLKEMWSIVGGWQEAAAAGNSVVLTGPTVVDGGSTGSTGTGTTSGTTGGTKPNVVSSIVSTVVQDTVDKAMTAYNKIRTSLGFATGGDVVAGVPITVGEAGREIFVPSVPGRIVDHWQSEQMLHGNTTYNNGSNITLTQYITVTGGTTRTAADKAAGDFVNALQKRGINPRRI